eukprot:COSAG01_NODE_32708_length_577_cov_0.665272_1_plen_144_part_01
MPLLVPTTESVASSVNINNLVSCLHYSISRAAESEDGNATFFTPFLNGWLSDTRIFSFNKAADKVVQEVYCPSQIEFKDAGKDIRELLTSIPTEVLVKVCYVALGNRNGLKSTTTCSRGVTDKDLTFEMTRGRQGQSKNLAQNT